MSIRRRLAYFFILMTALVFVMGFVLYRGGPIIVGAFRDSLGAMHSLNAIREFKSDVIDVRTALNRFLLLDDPKEELNYKDSSRDAQEALKQLGVQLGAPAPAWFVDLQSFYLRCDKAALQVVSEYKKGQKAKAHDHWSNELYPQFQKLFDVVDQLEQEKNTEADRTFQAIQRLSSKMGTVVMVVSVFVLFVAFLSFFSLYRAVMNPLESLREGADEFGKGHWDHRIDSLDNNEFGTLAKSFNQMAENVKQLQLQAVHMDRMSAVGQLAGGVAHEINNPLTAVLGQAQILLAKMPETEPAHGAIKKMIGG